MHAPARLALAASLLFSSCAAGSTRLASCPDTAPALAQPAAPTRAAESVTPIETAPAEPAPPPPAPAVTELAHAQGDLDGDRIDETVRLYSDGTLRVFHGATEVTDARQTPAGALASVRPEGGAEFAPAELSIVDIDRRDRQRELVVRETYGDEDPPSVLSFWVFREGRLWSMLRDRGSRGALVDVPHGVRPTVAGDGSVRFSSTQCVRDASNDGRTPGVEERSEHRFVIADGTFTHGDLVENVRASRRPSSCIQAACPVVYAGASTRAAGEILRDLRDPSLERWQGLRIAREAVDAEGVLTVTLREEKHEVTELDALYLEADGARVMPDECARGGLSWCDEGGLRETLRAGQSLRVTFRVGAARELRLWARGYYVPLAESPL